MTPDDLALILERITIRTRSELTGALRTTREWADTVKAANYSDDKGGNRWETDLATGEVNPIPPDPTGDQAVNPDVVAQMHGQLQRLIRRIHSTCAEYENILDQASPDPSKHPKLPDDNLNEVAYCRSCATDRGRKEPVAMQYDSTGKARVRYKGECRWCHDFKAEYGRYPTPSLIRKHHTPYARVTESDINRALGLVKSTA